MHPFPLSASQNFLHSRTLVDHLLAHSSIRAGDLVFDLGAGGGRIAERLANRGCTVVAIERDPHLAAALAARFADQPRVRILRADILDVPLPRQTYKVFANIPFSATAAIVERLTHAACPPEDAYLVVQREAALRFVGQPRGTLVSALLKPWFEPTIVHRFRRTDFAPPPRVEVVMLRLRKRGPPLVRRVDERRYRDLVVAVFTARRLSVLDTLRGLVGSRRARRLGLDPSSTPSELAFERWLDLFETLKSTPAVFAGAERRLLHQQRRLRKVHRTRRQNRTDACRPPPGSLLYIRGGSPAWRHSE
jgi:23S rRNA (adenine-N6)-dimethyltransferase